MFIYDISREMKNVTERVRDSWYKSWYTLKGRDDYFFVFESDIRNLLMVNSKLTLECFQIFQLDIFNDEESWELHTKIVCQYDFSQPQAAALYMG